MRIKYLLRRILALFSLENFGLTLPVGLVALWCATAIVAALGLPEIRVVGYVALLFSAPLGILAFVRQIREAQSRGDPWPSLVQVSLFWQRVALLLLTIGIVSVFANMFAPGLPDIPPAFYTAQIMTGGIALAITDLVLYFGGRKGKLSYRTRPGPMALFVRKYRGPRVRRRERDSERDE